MRGARLSTTQIYNTQSSLKTDDECLGIEATYNVGQPVAKSYFQFKLKLQYQSVIITPLRTYLYGQKSFWMEVICLQHLLIEYLGKCNFLKIADVNSIFADVKSIIQLSRRHFFGRREIIWVRKTALLLCYPNLHFFFCK